ncbi:hypothetical protein, partial [Methylophilus sp. 3sh_L]|uniref:hypothetical protein n=1 Tax=Methylophilus sp. 3sh_L TaxID=3377114 RepID=UPI00398E465E
KNRCHRLCGCWFTASPSFKHILKNNTKHVIDPLGLSRMHGGYLWRKHATSLVLLLTWAALNLKGFLV